MIVIVINATDITSPNKYFLDKGLGLVADGTDWQHNFHLILSDLFEHELNGLL